MKHDLTRPPDLLHETHMGPTRVQRPDYVSLLPPCNAACPAGENIQAWLALAIEKRYKAAWQALIEENPLPAVHGRVCYHPCETGCNRSQLDSPVSIHAVERFLGDRAIRKGWQVEWDAPASGKRVLIVGAGPSGLSAAYHLTRLGHSVEIREAGPMAGGMMHFGIPAYRMPRDVLDAEIRRIEDMGVKIVLNHKVEDLMAERDAGHFDAVFVAIGAHISKHIDIPARDAGKMLDAVSFLASVEAGEAPQLGRRVAIYGGGNTAMDAARVAKRLGADEALIIYRRDREHMPAHPFEADEAIEEGVKINWLRTIKEIDATTFTVEVMEVDEDGRPQSTGKLETLEADSLILALGQNSDTSLLKDIQGIEIRVGHRHRRRAHDDRPSRHLRRRRHGALGTHRHRGRRPRQEGGPQHRRLAAWRSLYGAAEKPARQFRQAACLVFHRRRAAPAGESRPAAAPVRLRGSGAWPEQGRRRVRGTALPVLRQLLRMRRLFRGLPGTRHHQARQAQGLCGEFRQVHRLWRLLRAVPLPCHRHDPRARLKPARECTVLNYAIVFSGLTAGPWSNAWKTGK